MKLIDIMNEFDSIVEIDESNLSRESLQTPKIYARFLRYRTDESVRMNQLKVELKKLYLTTREYYDGKADASVYKEKPFNRKLLKSELDQYVEADDDMQTLMQRIEVQQEKLNYLNDALKMIANRNFQIKAAIDYQKLMAGIV